MSHSYKRLFFHIVWSTSKRTPSISKSIKKRLYDYIASLIIKEGVELIAIGGSWDHVHILIKSNKLISIPKFVRYIKSCSSKFVNTINNLDYFAWQKGYGIFSVSPTRLKNAINYINNQEKHHKPYPFEKELKLLLDL